MGLKPLISSKFKAVNRKLLVLVYETLAVVLIGNVKP